MSEHDSPSAAGAPSYTRPLHIIGDTVERAPAEAITPHMRVRAIAWLVAWLTTWLSFVVATWLYVLDGGRLWGAALFWLVLALGVTTLGLKPRDGR